MRHSASQGNIIIDLNDFITHSTKEKSGGGGGGQYLYHQGRIELIKSDFTSQQYITR